MAPPALPGAVRRPRLRRHRNARSHRDDPGNGDFLVSDGSRINRYNKTTGAFVSTFLANGAGGFTSKGDMLFGPDGNFYVVDQDAANNNGVAKFNGSSGAFLGMLVAPGLVPDTIGGIAFGNDGDLYLSRTLTTTTAGDVRRFDGTTGTFLGVFINDATRLPAPQDILFTPEPASLSIAAVCAGPARARKKRSRVRSTPADPASPENLELSALASHQLAEAIFPRGASRCWIAFFGRIISGRCAVVVVVGPGVTRAGVM
jgi:hypothetical protein